jgi:hypothetical protein
VKEWQDGRPGSLRSPDQAHSVLRWFHATGEVTAKQIADALRKRDELVAEIRARLEELGRQGARFLTVRGKPRRRRVSPKAQAAWRAQGRYMAAVRRLSKSARAKVAAIRKAKSVGTAVAAAKKIAKA